MTNLLLTSSSPAIDNVVMPVLLQQLLRARYCNISERGHGISEQVAQQHNAWALEASGWHTEWRSDTHSMTWEKLHIEVWTEAQHFKGHTHPQELTQTDRVCVETYKDACGQLCPDARCWKCADASSGKCVDDGWLA